MKRSLSLALLALALSGCTRAPEEPVSISEAHARSAALPGGMGAAFFTIENRTDQPDRLTGVDCPLAESVEIHESFAEAEVMRMRRIPELQIPARATVRLEPGGLHLMLIGMRATIAEGETIPLALHFEHAGTIPLEAPVER